MTVEVTDADIEAACSWLESWEPGPELTQDKLADAFARHRELSERKYKAWHDAVIDELIITHLLSLENEADPKKALNDLMVWHQQIALDPAVSKDARKLLAEGERIGLEKAAGRHLRELSDEIIPDLNNIARAIEDEGDRCYLGSTNDADALSRIAEWLDHNMRLDS